MAGIKKDQKEPRKFDDGVKQGGKYLAAALPLLFISPILITIGFKALAKDQSYWMLSIGCILALITIALVTQGIRIILKALFDS